MKTIFTLICFIGFGSAVFSQVAIGKSAVSSTGASLEFGTGNRGLVLPWTTSTTAVDNASPGGAKRGTLIYDLSTHKVRVKNNTEWFDLSVNESGTANTSIQDTKTDKPDAKVVIGENGATDSTVGVLVLSDTDKAMVLPKVASPHLNIMNPAPGMIVYDTVSRQLAVYNGTVWTFWKPE